MSKKRRNYSAEFKFRVALEAVREIKTISELASEHEIHPTVIRGWKRQLINEGASVFQQASRGQEKEAGVGEAELYEQIGRLKMELEWLKKKAAPFS